MTTKLLEIVYTNPKKVYEISLEFKLQDLWIGAFWKTDEIWICILPCLPIHISKKDNLDGH